jgi:hypothetical protein
LKVKELTVIFSFEALFLSLNLASSAHSDQIFGFEAVQFD